jgi:hypothetical protein
VANFFDQFDGGGAKPASPYADAISSVESGGNYHAIGPDTGNMGRALGKYQVMSANVGPWSKEVLGREISPREFISNPALQDAIFPGQVQPVRRQIRRGRRGQGVVCRRKGHAQPERQGCVRNDGRRIQPAVQQGAPQGADQGARAAVEQIGQEPPQAMAFADDRKASPVQPGAKNFFDQFDQAPAQQPAQPRAGRPSPLRRSRPPAGPRCDRCRQARGAAQGFTANFGDEMQGSSRLAARTRNPASLTT